jgi:hypothetical protein
VEEIMITLMKIQKKKDAKLVTEEEGTIVIERLNELANMKRFRRQVKKVEVLLLISILILCMY